MKTERIATRMIRRSKLALQTGRCLLMMLALAWFGMQPASAQHTPAGNCFPAVMPGDSAGRVRNAMSDCYSMNQAFDGQSFFKDNNIWTVTKRFAETFGMPMDWIDPALTDIEAAAFRIEDASYKLCGMGGKAEQCKKVDRCMLDIYVDEKRNPLPWATAQRADWYSRYNSINWLRTATEKPGARIASSQNLIPNVAFEGSATLHPFADPDSKKEAIFLSDARIDGEGDNTFNAMLIFGFVRNSIANLSMVSLEIGCTAPNRSKQHVKFRLETRDKVFSPPLKRFLEFRLSEKFTQQMRSLLLEHQELEARFFRSLFNFNPTESSK